MPPRARAPVSLTLFAFLAGVGCERSDVPPGFARGTGRLEAEEIHVATKLPGRVAEVLVDEGDLVDEGQVLAQMVAATLEAELAEAHARVEEAKEHRKMAMAALAQRESECALAEKEFDRARGLHEQAVVSEARVDQEHTRVETAKAACDAARARLEDVASEIEAAEAAAERARAELQEATLRAPRAGQVQYRLAEPGEVLPAGGRLVTLLDLDDVTMAVFLPTADAGRVRIGAESRVVLDAHPETPLPARVSFVAREAQFTPRQVETETERQKLSFRVEVRVIGDGGVPLNSGSPGVAWVRLDDQAAWPEQLRVAGTRAAR